MPTKTVENARKLQRQLETGTTGHAIPAADTLDANAPSDERLALDAPLRTLLARTTASFNAFAQAEHAVAREGGEDQDARRARDDAAAPLYQLLSRLALTLTTSWGRPTTERLALAGPTPTVPEQLVTAARAFLAVTDPLPTLPPAQDAWTVLDLPAARDAVLNATTTLEAALTDTSRETRETQAARRTRDLAADAWKRDAALCASLARATLRYAGQHDLAERLLPTASAIRAVATLNPTELDPPTTDTPIAPT